MLVFSALVAGSFSLGAQVANEIDPLVITLLRFIIALVIIGAAALMTGGLRRQVFVAPWRYAILGFLLAFYFAMMFEGLKTATAVSVAAVFTLTPAIAAGFGWILLRQRMTKRIALALAIGGAGAVWVIFRADLQALLSFNVGRGEMIYFLGCVAHALYAPMVPRLNRGESAIDFTFGALLAGTVILAFLAAPAALATDWAALSWLVWVTLFYLAIIATTVTFLLLQYASLRLPASKVMAYTYLVPSWVICWDITRGQPAPPLLILVGIGMTVLALLLLLRPDAVPSEA